jgi:hypothetical protein
MKNRNQKRRMRKTQRAKRHEQQTLPLRRLLESLVNDYFKYQIRQGENAGECNILRKQFMRQIDQDVRRGSLRSKLQLLWAHVMRLLEVVDGTMVTAQTNEMIKELVDRDLQIPSGHFPLDIFYMVGFMISRDKPIFFEYNNVPVELGHPIMAYLDSIDIQSYLAETEGTIIIDCEKHEITVQGLEDKEHLVKLIDEQESLNEVYHFVWLRKFIANGGMYVGPSSSPVR